MKYCEVGEHEVEKLWIAKGKTKQSACQSCARQNYKPKLYTDVVERKGITIVNVPRKPIKKVGTKQARINAAYSILKADFLSRYPACQAQLTECTYYSTDVHHGKGRGIYTLDSTTYIALCRNCHSYIELHPKEAKELRFSVSRLEV